MNRLEAVKSFFFPEAGPVFYTDKFTDEDLYKIESIVNTKYWTVDLHKSKKFYSDEMITEQFRLFDKISVDSPLFRRQTAYSYSLVKNAINTLFEQIISEKPDIISGDNYVHEIFNQIIDDLLEHVGLQHVVGDVIDFEFWNTLITNYSADTRHFRVKQEILKELPNLEFSNYNDMVSYGDSKLSFLRDSHHIARTYVEDLCKIHLNKTKIYMSKFNTLEELEENLTAKQLKTTGAKEFYLDTSKKMSERVKVFNEYGEDNGCIYRPITKELKHIFEWYYESDYPSKMETILTSDVVNDWVDLLKFDRITVVDDDLFEDSVRNYTPSKEALERLKNYYLNKLMKEGIAKFTYDW